AYYLFWRKRAAVKPNVLNSCAVYACGGMPLADLEGDLRSNCALERIRLHVGFLALAVDVDTQRIRVRAAAIGDADVMPLPRLERLFGYHLQRVFGPLVYHV